MTVRRVFSTPPVNRRTIKLRLVSIDGRHMRVAVAGIRVTEGDVRRWLTVVGGFPDPDDWRAQRYARNWKVRDKIREALTRAYLAGRPRDSIFNRH